MTASAGVLDAAAQSAVVPGGLTALPQTIAGPNLVTNAGFETQAGAVPAGWTGGSTWAADQLVKRTGTFSYRRGSNAPTAAQTITVKKGVYKLSAWVKAEALGAGSNGLRLTLDSRAGGVGEWTPSAIIQGTFDWKLIEVGPVVISTDRKVAVQLENYGGAAGTAWFDDVKLEQHMPQPVDVFLLYPNYRGMLFDDQSQTIKLDVTVTPPGGDMAKYQVKTTLSDETSGTAVASQTYPASEHFVAELPGGAMQPGRAYAVKVSLVDLANNAAVYTYPAYRVSKVPGSARATMNMSFDDKNRLLMHGKPRFVLGVYDSGSSYGNNDAFWESQLWSPTGERRMHDMKINMYLNYWFGQADATSMKSLMTNLQKHGIMYLQTGNCFATWPAAPNKFLIDTSDSYVQDIGAHPGSAGYYTIDECVSSLVPEQFTQYQRLKKLDPDSITFSALLAHPPDVFLWRDAADIITTDPYPMYGAEPSGGYKHNAVADWTVQARDAVKDSRPFMTVLQFFKFTSQGRWPTLQEMRNHAYMAIVEGARGLWWWSLGDNALKAVCSGWCAEKTAHMNNLKSVINEIAALEPVLLADDAPTALTSNSNPTAIRTKVKVVDGKGYLFAYNYTGATASASFGWNTAAGTVTVNAENRTIAASGSTFSDTFQPYQAHVYVIGNGGTGGGGGGGTTAPSVSFSNPAANATVTGTATVSMAAAGGSGSGYTYRLAVDGTTVYTGSNGTFSWNTTATSNGARTLTATATDSAGKSGTATRTVTVSNTTPAPAPAPGSLRVSITQPRGGTAVTGTSWTVMWVEGASGTSNTYTLSVGGKQVATQTTSSTGPVSVPWNTASVANGAQTLTAVVKDATGKTGTSTVNITVNNGSTTPPPTGLTVGITSPASGATVSGTVTVAMAGAGATGLTYRMAVDGVNVYTGSAASYPWNTTTVANGARTLTATVTDAAGRTATATRTVTVANTTTTPAPGALNVSITAPTNGTTVRGTAWTVLWVQGTSGSANTYTLSVNGTTVATQTTSSTGPVSIPWNTMLVPNGPRTLTATVKDATGKTGTRSVSLNVSNGTTVPVPSTLSPAFTSPAAGATVRGTTTVGMSVSGSTAATRTFRLAVDGAVVSTQTVTGTSASFAWNTASVANGTRTLTLTVTDSAGKTASLSRQVTVSNATTTPTSGLRVTITQPRSGTTVRGTTWAVVWVEGGSGTSNTYTLSANGRVVATQVTASTGPVSMPWNTTATPNGAATLTATVKDATGKTGAASVTVTVGN